MSTNDVYAEPEQLIAAMNRKRRVMMLGALAGVIAVLGGLFVATAAMYSRETTGGIQTSKAALQPGDTQGR
jgi:hypothetical protein